MGRGALGTWLGWLGWRWGLGTEWGGHGGDRDCDKEGNKARRPVGVAGGGAGMSNYGVAKAGEGWEWGLECLVFVGWPRWRGARG